MAKILNSLQCEKINQLRKKFTPYAKKGWMCEGSETRKDGKLVLCNMIFNNETDEFILADYNGNIVKSELTVTPQADADDMALIQGKISLICEE